MSRFLSLLAVIAAIAVCCATTCKYVTPDATYDFSSLATDTDYMGKGNDKYNYWWSMNVCRNSSVSSCINRLGSVCQYKSWPSSVQAMTGSWFLEPEPTWSMIDASNPGLGVQLTYTNGDQCFPNVRKTIIEFICSDVQDDSFIVEEPKTCEYHIKFNTPLACGGTPPTTCTFSSGGYDFDIGKMLTSTDYTGTDGDYDYSMNVCGLSNDARCSAAKGSICQYTQEGSNAGATVLGSSKLSPTPVWSLIDPMDGSKGVVLSYSNGDLCASTGKPRATTVYFPCSQKQDKEFYIREASPCVYNVSFSTPFACPLSRK